MEQPFYHDDSFLLGYAHNDATLHDYKLQKQSMNLNLTEQYRSLKSELYQSANGDVGSLKLASPELERLIIQNSNGVLTTPTPGQYLYGRGITDEQEGFAEGFVRALAELHHQHMPNVTSAPQTTINNSMAPVASVAGGAVYSSSMRPDPPVYADLNTFNPATNPAMSFTSAPPPPHSVNAPLPVQHPRLQALKEEPQTVPEMPGETPPLSPIDMESQERIKAERKRMRNRIAASKCRKRKLERISRLEDKVKNLKSQNSELASTANMLRDQVAQLKQKVMNHVNSGCQLMLTQQLQTF